MTKIVIIGLDGADWETIHNWAKEGLLPNLKKLMEEGSSGPLESTIPTTTPPAWTSLVTGKKPEKHGILGFNKVERDESGWKISVYTARDKKSAELWDYVNNIVAINVPFTYPPREINGILVTGMGTPSLSYDFTYPPEFKDELLGIVPDLELDINLSEIRDKDIIIKKVYDLTSKRIKLFKYIFNKYDWRVLFYVFTEPDRIQHVFWGTEEVKSYWIYLDNFIGEVIQMIQQKAEVENEEIYLFLVSDHGFTKVKGMIDVNCLLTKIGLLRKVKNYDSENTVIEKIIIKLFGILGYTYIRLPYTIRKFLSPVADMLVKTKYLKNYNPEYDYDHSIAFGVHEGKAAHIFINPALTDDEKERIIIRIKTSLEKFRDKSSHEQIIKVVRGRDIYDSPANGVLLPDLVLIPNTPGNEGYHFASMVVHTCMTDTEGVLTQGGHRLSGIVLIYGPGVKKNFRINAKIYDILPTVLHILNLPIPRDVDGRVLMEIFEPDSILAKREVKCVESSYYAKKEELLIKKAVKELKKMGKI